MMRVLFAAGYGLLGALAAMASDWGADGVIEWSPHLLFWGPWFSAFAVWAFDRPTKEGE